MQATATNLVTSAFLPNTGGFSLIAGPCSAESETQVLEAARGLAPLAPAFFRMGIWKPRTRPGGFAGVESEGLDWILKVTEATGLRVITEVATPEMAEAALKAGAAALWIGARTTVNPFAVQEIAETLAGANVPVLVKNPVNPDLGLWLGAIERMERAGCADVAACHRGFSLYGKQRYRNVPQWEIPLELRRLRPTLPLLCDPSHITGRRELLPEVAQRALDLGFDGLMIEAHPSPEQALSDAAQQLTPQALATLLAGLRFHAPESDDPGFNRSLRQLRAQVDEIDLQLLQLLSRRLSAANKIGLLKQEASVRPFQLERWMEVFQTRKEWAAELGLSPEFMERFLQLLHLEMLRMQEQESETLPRPLPQGGELSD